MTYELYRINDDETTTYISNHDDLLTGIAAGEDVVSTEDFDFAYGLYADGVRVAAFAEGRIGYRMWATRTGRINYSVEDRYEHDEDMLLA